MGSLVLAYPMMKYLEERYPESQLSVLVFHKNREVIELLDIIGEKNILTIRVDSNTNFLWDSAKVIRKIRVKRFDAVIDCELFARVTSLFSFFSGAPTKAGFHGYTQEGLYRGDFINRPVPYNPYVHISKQFLNLAYALENNTVPGAKHMIPTGNIDVPKAQFSTKEIEQFSDRLFRDFPQIQDRPLVLVYPSGGMLPVRAWPFENYRHLSKALIGEEISVGIIGLDSDSKLGQEISAHTSSEYCYNLTGYTETIQELLLLINRADLLITNDGGPGQFAALTETPAIIFFGPESPQLYAPLSPDTYILFRHLACSPCLSAYNHRNSPCDGDNQCLKTIRVDDVLAKAREILALNN
jgi:lipopolysaccharide heptosyltransferase II